MDVSTRIRGERSGFHVRSVQNFVRLGRAEEVAPVSRGRGNFAACGTIARASGISLEKLTDLLSLMYEEDE